jgi:hypothetical protein
VFSAGRPRRAARPLGSGITSGHVRSDTRGMIATERERRATDRLLADVRRLERRSLTAPQRLEVEVGGDFARLLVFALSGTQDLRGRGLRGRSCP